MIEIVAGALLAPLLDPAASVWRSRATAERLVCEHLDPNVASRRFPGEIRPEPPRGSYVDRSVLHCRTRLIPPHVRRPEDAAVLERLTEHAKRAASFAAGARPALRERTWMVEAFHTNPQVVSKLIFATQTALLERGLTVTDRRPTLAIGEITILGRLDPIDAYPAACARYAAAGSVGPDHALLALVRLDRRETEMHVGICADSRWEWLR